VNTQRVVRLVRRPNGRAEPDIFDLQDAPIPTPGPGEFLLRNLTLSMDPAMLQRLRGEANYAESVEVGQIMHAYGVGQVIASNHPAVRVGEIRLGRVDMAEYALQSDPDESTVLNLGIASEEAYLSVCGITGATAIFSLFDLGEPKAGETIVISAGGSSVGATVMQLAKRAGMRTVGIVSTDEKAARMRQKWGYDAAVSYRGKSVETLAADLAAVCPNGVDLYYDNTSGDISEALLDLYNERARILVIGRLGISHLSDSKDDVGRRDNNVLLTKRIRKQGFVLLDYKPRMKGGILLLAKWVKSGALKAETDVLEGIDRVPEAFFRMVNGQNQGKQLVRLAQADARLDPSPRWLGRALTSRLFPTRTLATVLTRGLRVPR